VQPQHASFVKNQGLSCYFSKTRTDERFQFKEREREGNGPKSVHFHVSTKRAAFLPERMGGGKTERSSKKKKRSECSIFPNEEKKR